MSSLVVKLLVIALLPLMAESASAADSARAVSGCYLAPCGLLNGKEIWIVDGETVRRSLYREFLYGGNGQRYQFIPESEIWIDNAIDAEEYGYTVAHEMKEYALMAGKGLTYADAHDSALALERRMRLDDQRAARRHESVIGKVSPTDCDGTREIAGLPDSVALSGIYRVPLGRREGIAVWVVDGAAVRRDLFPDFGFSGNDRAYRFIPRGEIWIDAQVSCEETEFSIASELAERALLSRGKGYDSAYEQSLAATALLRGRAASAAAAKAPVRIPKQADREVGTGRAR